MSEQYSEALTPSTTSILARVLVWNTAGEVLILTRADNDPDRPGDLDLPGGEVCAIDPETQRRDSESLLEGAARECREEIGITIKPDSLRLVAQDTRPKNGKLLDRVLLETSYTKGNIQLSPEHSAYRWGDPNELVKSWKHPVWSTLVAVAIARRNRAKEQKL